MVSAESISVGKYVLYFGFYAMGTFFQKESNIKRNWMKDSGEQGSWGIY